MRVVAILNQKGGVGKTTTAVNLGAALARGGPEAPGRRVLLIDTDPQANLSDHLGVDAGSRGSTVYDVLTEGAPASEAIVETSTERLWVLPADADLAAAEQELATEIAREMRLGRALGALDQGAFDWVLIDCPPSLGLLSLNAMAAADDVLITVQAEYFAMRGLSQIDQIVDMVRTHVNPRLEVLGILPTLVNPWTRLAREVVQEIRRHYGELVFDTRIRQNVRLAEAPGHQQHIFDYDAESPGAQDYLTLAREVEARLKTRSMAAAAKARCHPDLAPEPPQQAEAVERDPSEVRPEPTPEPEAIPEPEPVSAPVMRPVIPPPAITPPAIPPPAIPPVITRPPAEITPPPSPPTSGFDPGGD